MHRTIHLLRGSREGCQPSKVAKAFEDCKWLRRLHRSSNIACAASLQSSKVRAIYGRGRQINAESRQGRDSHENPDNPRDPIGAHAPAGIVWCNRSMPPGPSRLARMPLRIAVTQSPVCATEIEPISHDGLDGSSRAKNRRARSREVLKIHGTLAGNSAN